MNILEKFILRGKNKKIIIGIGLGKSNFQNIKILNACRRFLQKNDSNIFFFGDVFSINHIIEHKSFKEFRANMSVIKSVNPEYEMIKYLKNKQINAAIRGGLSSAPFLDSIKEILAVSEINRLALMETYREEQFFFGPVGIDECNSFLNKVLFIEKALKEFKALNITPKISVLSGGRNSDLGRDPLVDLSIKMAVDLVDYFQENYPNIMIKHDEILIENAVNDNCNLIVAPNGISGNLIYRTLVHLGEGKAFGAIYMDMGHTIIDTSSVGDASEIYGALILSLALTP